MWSWAEWLVHQRRKGAKWLADILSTPLVKNIMRPGRRLCQLLIANLKATSSQLVTASRNRSRSRRLEKQNIVLPTVMGDKVPSRLSGFVNATKTAIKGAVLDHLSDGSFDNRGWEMEASNPVVIMGEGARAPWFWSCGPDEEPVCLMLKITNAHSDMIKCVSISPLCFSFIDTFRHMQFNPGANHHNAILGFVLATHSRGTVRLWDSQNGPNAIQQVHGFADLDTTFLGSGYKRYAWDPNSSRLLTRVDKETQVWSSVR